MLLPASSWQHHATTLKCTAAATITRRRRRRRRRSSWLKLAAARHGRAQLCAPRRLFIDRRRRHSLIISPASAAAERLADSRPAANPANPAGAQIDGRPPMRRPKVAISELVAFAAAATGWKSGRMGEGNRARARAKVMLSLGPARDADAGRDLGAEARRKLAPR